jgi:hypothetical protein
MFLLAQVLAKDYSGYKVYRLFNHYESAGLEVWERSHGWMDILLAPGQQLPMGVDHKLLLPDVQDMIDQGNDHRSRHSDLLIQNGIVPNASQIFKDYYDYDTLVSFFESLPFTSKEVIGSTYLGRDIYAFNFGTGKRRIVIQGGIHAREWIAPAVVTWIAYWLNSQDSPAGLLENFSWSIIPVVNVDGYDYTRSTDRLWRKNRQPNQGSSCVGVDPNRNFGFEWGTGGASSNPCAQDFKGYNPFDVPCTAAISKYVSSFPKGEVLAFFDFHSYSQLWMFPYGYNCGLKIPEYDTVDKASKIAISAIENFIGTKYREGPICNVIYKATGSSTDHIYAMGVPFSFGIELPDRGQYGFLLRKFLFLNNSS